MSNDNIVGEASGLAERDLPEFERKAIERAKRAGGHVDMGDRTPAEYAARERAGRHTEKPVDEKLDTTLSGEVRAKYKIEVTFAGPDERTMYKGRTVQGPNRLGIQIWESGKRFHGGGDELMYWCKDNRQDHDEGCWAAIPGDCLGEIAVCPSCKRSWDPAFLTNMKIGNVTSQTLAKDLATLFRQLGSNADVYLKFHRSDIHYIAMEREKGPEVAKRLKGMHIYPLKNILKDTMSGADVAKRFFAFVTS